MKTLGAAAAGAVEAAATQAPLSATSLQAVPQPSASFPYRIVAKVGEGGMGNVYRADDLELGRAVAIKLIKPSFIDSLGESSAHNAMLRFQQEARAAAALTHPGVTAVYRVGTEGGWPYIAMEWVEGTTLEAMLGQRGPLSIKACARLGVQVLSALHAAHHQGIVHRDIKPANLMVTSDGRVKVTDFGIARVQGSNLAQTQMGVVLGTPQYAAPEQLAGQAIDGRADLYALSAVLYESLVGQPPFDSASIFELIHLVQVGNPEAPSARRAGLDPVLDAVLLKGLARDAEQRYRSAEEMAAALQPFVAGDGPRTTPPPAHAEISQQMRLAKIFVAEGRDSRDLIVNTVRQWPARALGRHPTAQLIARVLDRPLHAEAFTGVLELGETLLLISDGIVHGALDQQCKALGDAVIEALPENSDATLRALPEGLPARALVLLASSLHVSTPRLQGLDASLTDLPSLAHRLSREGFDGVFQFSDGQRCGLAYFDKGQPVLELRSPGWQGAGPADHWVDWIASSGAIASVVNHRPRILDRTYRQQLADLELEVRRPDPASASSLRADTLEEARAIQLHPVEGLASQIRRGDSTVEALLLGDPASELGRWALGELSPQFEQYNRASRWKALVAPLQEIERVRLHPGFELKSGETVAFDAALLDGRGETRLVLRRSARGDAKAVESFVRDALTLRRDKSQSESLGAAILVAPSFSEEALALYLQALEQGKKKLSLDALSHREGFVRTSGRAGLHLLLIEESDGRRRPLMPQ